MKRVAFVLVIALVSSGIAMPFASIPPSAAAMDMTALPVLVYSSATVMESQALASSDDGRIYIAWSERVGETSDIFISHSSNNGTSFSSKARVNRIDAGSQRAAQVATADDMLYVVWEDGSGDPGDIVLSRSDDGGLGFAEVSVSAQEAGTQSNPAIAASGDDVAIAWEEFRSDNTIRIWDGVLGGAPREISGHVAAVRAAEFSPNNTYVASGSEDRTVKIWNAATGALVRNITSHTAEVMAVNWSADGNILASGSYDHNVTLYDTTDFSVITKLNATGGTPTRNNVNAICFSPDSASIAVGFQGLYGTSSQPTGNPTDNFNVTVWNISDKSGWTRNELTPDPDKGHRGSVNDIAFSHNGTCIASGGEDSDGYSLKVWDAATGQLISNVQLGQSVMSVSWSPDDTVIAAGLWNGSIALVNSTNPTDIGWMGSTHTGRVNSLDWSTFRGELVSGASDPVAKVWDDVTGTESLMLPGHMNSVYSVDWSSGNLVVTAGGNSHFYAMGENQIFCAVSDDRGITFSAPAMVSDSCASNRLRPRVGMDAQGNVTVTWYDARKGGTNIYIANSTDGGATFGANIAVTTDSDENTIPSIFVSRPGVVHLVWQYGNGNGIRYANSSNGYSPVVMATTAQTPHVTGSPDGTMIWASWRHRDSVGLMNYIYINASDDGGASFADRTALVSDGDFIGEHAIYIDSFGQGFAAWEANEASSESLYFRTTVLDDLWQPYVLYTSPEDGQADVSIFTSFTIRFSEPMDRVSVEAAFSWTDGTRTWTVGNCTDNSGNWYAAEGGYGDLVTFTPEKEDRLRYSKSGYSFKVAGTAADTSGNDMGSDLVVHFQTSADTDPPLIEHFPAQTTVSYDKAYGVMAMITDQWGNVSEATLHYQGVSDSSPVRSVDMVPTSQGMYRAEIPAQLALGDVYYYISAEDAFGNEAWNPANYTNHSELYTVAVIDGVKPLIIHSPVQEEDVFSDISIWAVVTDEVQLQEVRIHFRPIGANSFTTAAMQPDSNGTLGAYRFEIPAQPTIGQVAYNITAVDGSGNFNSTPPLTVQVMDSSAPVINQVKPTMMENETQVRVTANVTDDVGVDTVTLYFKAVGGDQWVSRQMDSVGGSVYEFTIPAQRRSGTIYYYVNATDMSGNVASTLNEQDEFQVEVVGVGEDNTLYYILGGILAALVIVMVYLAIRKFSGPARGGPSEEDEPDAEPSRKEIQPEKVDDGQ